MRSWLHRLHSISVERERPPAIACVGARPLPHIEVSATLSMPQGSVRLSQHMLRCLLCYHVQKLGSPKDWSLFVLYRVCVTCSIRDLFVFWKASEPWSFPLSLLRETSNGNLKQRKHVTSLKTFVSCAACHLACHLIFSSRTKGKPYECGNSQFAVWRQ